LESNDGWGWVGEDAKLSHRWRRAASSAKLTRSSFDLETDEPAIVVKAGAKNKYKSERHVPLKAATVPLLRAHLLHKMPEAPAFTIPPRQHAAKTVKADLDAARLARIAESPSPEIRDQRENSDFLKYKDSVGRFLDFHAFRHTRGVWLFEHHKAHPREVQELVGVSSLALVDRYTRSFRLTDLSVIERDPDLSVSEPVKRVRKNGTHDDIELKILPVSLPLQAGFRQTLPDEDGILAVPGRDEFSRSVDEDLPGNPHALTPKAESDTVTQSLRRGGRAAECAGFENRLTARLREFESPPLR